MIVAVNTAASSDEGGGLTDTLARWVESVIEAIGYAGVAFLVALENVCPPIPSEVVLPAAGLWAKENGGVGSLGLMIVAATIGSVVGAWALYAFAAKIGPDRLRAMVVKKGRWVGLKESDLDRAESWFDNRNEMAVLVCRCVPLVRSLVSIPAGFRHMGFLRYTLYTALGSAIWNSALIVVGYEAAAYQDEIADVISKVQYLLIAIVVGAVGYFLYRRRHQIKETVADRA
jgi:membrane protein DedA with SNARE-associated domain